MSARDVAFGETYTPTWVDRFGIWLSATQINRYVRDFSGLNIGDFGCGYHASFARTLQQACRELVLVDVSLSPALKTMERIATFEGSLPDVLTQIPDASLDIALSMSVAEHLWNPVDLFEQMRRVLVPGGLALINVPSWRGKWFLEFSAFRLGLSPAAEMNDHKMYYDVRDLWPLLIRAGFTPENVRCFAHKFGLNTFAVCKK